MILGVLNQKGGSGKSTCALNLAAALALDGWKVLVVDADPQASSLAWSAARTVDPLFPVVGMAKATLHRELPELAKGYDAVIIDGAPRVNDLGRSVIAASDVIVIPVQPSPFDVWAAADIVQLIREAAIHRPRLKAGIAINRRIAGTAIGRDVVDALLPLDLPVFEAFLSQRVIYAESIARGLAAVEAAPTGEAAREVFALAAEIVEFYKSGKAVADV